MLLYKCCENYLHCRNAATFCHFLICIHIYIYATISQFFFLLHGELSLETKCTMFSSCVVGEWKFYLVIFVRCNADISVLKKKKISTMKMELCSIRQLEALPHCTIYRSIMLICTFFLYRWIQMDHIFSCANKWWYKVFFSYVQSIDNKLLLIVRLLSCTLHLSITVLCSKFTVI